jgi:hypothetical protein
MGNEMNAFLQFAHDTWLGDYTRHNSWVYTLGLVLHFIGLCLFMGGMLVIDLRILGVIRRVPIGAVLALLPVAIVGFVLNLLTGVMFFCFDSFGFWRNPAFKIKMVLVLLAGLNALWFTVAEHRRLAATPSDFDTGRLAKFSAAASLFMWFSVILFGRLIVAFQGSDKLF